MPFWILLGVGLLLCGAVMFGVWLLAVRIRNAGIVDIAWAANFSLLALLVGLLGAGDPLRRWVIAGMVIGWSLRLSFYLFRRVAGHHPEEDGRYKTLREAFPNRTNLMFLFFFEAQAILNALLSLPLLVAASNPAPGLRFVEILAIVIWAIALLGESLADAQLAKFRADPSNRGKTCRVGFWRYSRHPNYFFEWLTWVAFFVFALGSPWGWTAIIAPAVMLHFLINVTGIRATEEHALKSRGEDYRRYQQSTSMFFPWFPKANV